jgi:hypothetical protein
VRIEAVVLDIGDVLEVNPRTGWTERWATRLGMTVSEFDQRLGEIWDPGSVGMSSLEDIERETAARFELDDAALTSLMDDAWAEYVGRLNRELADYFAQLVSNRIGRSIDSCASSSQFGSIDLARCRARV